MSNTPAMDIYESTFAPSDQTDAILVLNVITVMENEQGCISCLPDVKKLHVNKALLSHYSDYFNALFNSDFSEKSMPEIPIKDVNFEDFAALLGLFQKNPISPTEENAENLLELADRFLIPAAKPQLEFFLISTEISKKEKLRIADKYNLDILLKHSLNLFNNRAEILALLNNFSSFSDNNKARILDRITSLPVPGAVPTTNGTAGFRR